MKAELEQLIALQKTDMRSRLLQAELDAIPLRRAEIEKEFEQRASEFRGIETKRDEARGTRERLESELAEMRTKAERAERNLMSSKNQKDYEAAIREIDASRKQISQLETQILERIEAFEQAEGEIGEREPEIAKMRAETEEKLGEFDRSAAALSNELSAARAERERLAVGLPKQVSALYNRISTRIRGGVAVAEARNGSCTACSMTLRPHLMAQIRRGDEVILCDNCNRILYYVHNADQLQKTTVSPVAQ